MARQFMIYQFGGCEEYYPIGMNIKLDLQINTTNATNFMGRLIVTEIHVENETFFSQGAKSCC